MKLKKHYFLMISCPGDVINERKLLKECVENINNERTDDAWVELIYWVTDTSSDASAPAQESINEQIVNDCDGLIAIFNARLGTPVHEYKCGTDEEISLMLKANKHVSLLFNTKPIIDLSNPHSIEQITKLQEYKNEQSKKAYYREFSDSESFLVLARREILMWLRNITKESPVDYISLKENPNSIDKVMIGTTGEQIKIDEENKTESNNLIDEEAGSVDCIVFITEATELLTYEVNNFTTYTTELSENTVLLGDKVNLLKKQSNGSTGLLTACKDFAKRVDDHNDKASKSLDVIDKKWDEVYRYLLILNKNSLTHEDKIILKDSIFSLKQCFEQPISNIDELISVLTTTPNIQKDMNRSVDKLSEIYKRFRSLVLKIVENCDELEGLFSF